MPDQNQSDPNNTTVADSQQTPATPVVPTLPTSPFDTTSTTPVSTDPLSVSSTPVNSSQSSSDTPPIFFPQEDAPPVPDFQAATTPVPPTNTQTEPLVATEQPSGSAAPLEPFAPAISSPKKKFGGGKIIATILGLLVLIGGVGTGVYLTQQQQLFQQKASSCFDTCRLTKGTQVCNCECSGICTRPDSQTPAPGEETTSGNCNASQTSPTWVQCGNGTGPSTCTFCLKPNQNTCSAVLATKSECSGSTSYGACGAITGAVDTFYCQGNPPPNTSNGCQRNDPLPGGVHWDDASNSIKGSFCGTVQVDDHDGSCVYPNGLEGPCFCSRTDTSGCSTNPTPTPPGITAQCQNVKAYSPIWTALADADLKKLTAGSHVNFCVTGVATAGNFDRAKFTINSVVQSETTTKRPTSQDFCQDYVIPTGVTAFTVTAQIHHVTLGYK